MLIQFVCYFRPGELCSLRASQVIPPLRHGGPSPGFWAFILGPFESGTPAKSKEFDESVILDLEELHWIYPFMAVLKRENANKNFWPFSQTQYHALVTESAVLGGVSVLQPEPYMLSSGTEEHPTIF